MVTRPKHYARWRHIKGRCCNPNHPVYKNYGGRGIGLFPDWVASSRPFSDWIEENLGPCPEGYTLDRIDNDRGYEPGNLRWADRRTQRMNQRHVDRPGLWGGKRPDQVKAIVPFSYDSSSYRLAEFYGVTRQAIRNRLVKHGYVGSSLTGLEPRKEGDADG